MILAQGLNPSISARGPAFDPRLGPLIYIFHKQAGWPNGKALDYESRDCRFDPCVGQFYFIFWRSNIRESKHNKYIQLVVLIQNRLMRERESIEIIVWYFQVEKSSLEFFKQAILPRQLSSKIILTVCVLLIVECASRTTLFLASKGESKVWGSGPAPFACWNLSFEPSDAGVLSSPGFQALSTSMYSVPIVLANSMTGLLRHRGPQKTAIQTCKHQADQTNGSA